MQSVHQPSPNYTTFGLNTDVVISTMSSDGLGGFSTFTYDYGPLQCGTVQGRLDCSFAWIRTTSDTGLVIVDEFYQTYPLTGMTRFKSTYETVSLSGYFSFSALSLVNMKQYNFVARYQYGSTNPTDIVLAEKITYQYELKHDMSDIFTPANLLKAEISEYTYDTYGNVIKAVENVTDNKVTYSRVTTSNYRNTPASWFIGEKLYQSVINMQKTSSSEWVSSPLREENYEWNQANRLISKVTSQPNDPVGIEETFQYNQFGNVIFNAQRAIATSETRNRTMVYDTNGLNMLSVKNCLQQQQSYSYDVADNLLQHTNLNGQQTVYTYDSFNRKIKTVYLGKTTTWSYTWDSPPSLSNSVYIITSVIGDTITEAIYYDAFNRPIRKAKQSFGGQMIYEDSVYNRMGSLVQRSLPYQSDRESPRNILFQYDSMLREVRRVENFTKGITITTQFNGTKVIFFNFIILENLNNLRLK